MGIFSKSNAGGFMDVIRACSVGINNCVALMGTSLTDFHIDLDYIRVDWNKFSTYTEDGWMNIKIWDPNVEIKWEKVYPIFYSVYWLIRNFAWMWYHELYWNIVWYDFDTNIDKFRAEINLPKIYRGFTSGDFLITVDWNTTSISDFDWNVDWITSDKIVITYNKKLDAGDWITLAIKFPKDYFNFDHERQNSLLWRVNTDSSSSSSFQSSFLDLFSNSDFISSILTFLIIIFWMFFMPNEWVGWSYSSWSSYSSSSWFSGGSSFGGWFSRGWWGGGWGSKSW